MCDPREEMALDLDALYGDDADWWQEQDAALEAAELAAIEAQAAIYDDRLTYGW